MKAKQRPCPPYNPGLRDLVQGKRSWSRSLNEEERKSGFRGWHERGYLPHRDEPGLVQFVTFRLADAFPEKLRAEWASLLQIEDDRRRRKELEAYLDKGRGACHLRQGEIARLVEDSLRFRHGLDYELLAWVVMPNHVHLLFKVLAVPMAQLVGAWKGYAAKEANRTLGRDGKFWQDGYWDTFMRSEEHERRARKYIEANPVKAGLAVTAREWPWGSARFRDDYERLCLPD
jgi:putative transposase